MLIVHRQSYNKLETSAEPMPAAASVLGGVWLHRITKGHLTDCTTLHLSAFISHIISCAFALRCHV